MQTTFIHLLEKLKLHSTEFLLLVLAFIAPIKMLLIICGFVIFLDLILGIKKSLRLKKRITSKGLYETVRKMFVYQVTIITIYSIDYFLLGEFIAIFTDIPLFLTKLVTIALVSVEIFSIHENIQLIWGINIPERMLTVLSKFFSFKKQFDKYND